MMRSKTWVSRLFIASIRSAIAIPASIGTGHATKAPETKAQKHEILRCGDGAPAPTNEPTNHHGKIESLILRFIRACSGSRLT